MTKKAKRRYIYPVVALAVAAGGFGIYKHRKASASEPVSYQSQALERGKIESTVTATGTLSARNTIQVGSQVSGRILALEADFNSRVTKGQVLAKLDPRMFEADVAKAKANLRSANANLARLNALKNDAYLKYKRAKALHAKSLIAKADLESAWASYTSAKAQATGQYGSVLVAKAAVEQANTNLAYTTIISPIDGIVISRDVDVGQTVAASLSAPTLFTIAEDLGKMEVHTSVAESDVGKIAAGQKVYFNVDAHAGKRFEGLVKQVRNAPTTVSNVVTYDAVIAVNNEGNALRPGMTANVTFVTAAREDAVLLPNAALRFQPDDKRPRRQRDPSKKRVWVMSEDGTLAPARVTVGISDGSMTEVVAGLEPGARVVIGTGNRAVTPARRRPGAGNRGGGNRFRNRSIL
jgi:HlyD family secretion protein